MIACHNTVVEYVFYGLINPGADCSTMMIRSKHRDNRPIIVHQSSYLSLHQSYWCLLMPTSVILETNTVRWSVALINSAETVSTLCPFICLLTPNSESHSSVSALEVGIWLDMLCTGLSCASVCSEEWLHCIEIIIHVPFFWRTIFQVPHFQIKYIQYACLQSRAVHLQHCFTEDLDHESIMEVGWKMHVLGDRQCFLL